MKGTLMKRIPMTTLLLAALVLVGCDGDPTGPDPISHLPRSLSVAEEAVVDGSNAFAFGLLAQVRAMDSDTPNALLSPLSASMALGMAMNGADGDTWAQMRDVLGFEGLDEAEINAAYRDLIALLLGLDPAVEVRIGNAAWVDDMTLLPAFEDRVESFFGAEVGPLDFDDPSSADVMNDWVGEVTNGKIRTLVERVNPDALLYLINAIYFQADWRAQFDEERTAPAAFRRADGSEVTVDMMAGRVGHRVLNAGQPGAVQGVELPYGGGAFGAVLLLPPEGQPIDELVATLDGTAWDGWMSRFDEVAEAGDPEGEGMMIRLPKFELEWGARLNGPLRALGMEDAFVWPGADFTRITDDRDDLHIYEVRQKTWVKVDEKGTEAAAATSVSIGPTSLPPSITFDRPFVFAIRERLSGTILFLGVIGDPS